MRWLYWVVGIFVLIVVWYNLAHPTTTFRYRATLTIETPQGSKSGSSVIEVVRSFHPFPGLSGGHSSDVKIRGIAPVVDLGSYGTLVAALKYHIGGETGRNNPALKEGLSDASAWPVTFWRGNFIKYISEKKELFTTQLPQFVWIPPGSSDPDNALPLMPREFSKYIGPVEFKSVTVEPTSDAVVERMEPAPAWLRAMRERYGTAYGGLPSKFDFHQSAVESDTSVEMERHWARKKGS